MTCPAGSAGTVHGASGTGGTSGCTTLAGYSGAVTATVTAPFYSEDLVENTCAAFNFPDSVEGGDTNPCTNGIQLKTTSGTTTCNVKCKAGYTGSTTTVTCASDAVEGASADSTVSCSGEPRHATPHPPVTSF